MQNFRPLTAYLLFTSYNVDVVRRKTTGNARQNAHPEPIGTSEHNDSISVTTPRQRSPSTA